MSTQEQATHRSGLPEALEKAPAGRSSKDMALQKISTIWKAMAASKGRSRCRFPHCARSRAQTNSAPSVQATISSKSAKSRQIFLPEIANAWGVEEGQTYVLIHSGSRGFGHQICQDTLDHFIKQGICRRTSRQAARRCADQKRRRADLFPRHGCRCKFCLQQPAANPARGRRRFSARLQACSPKMSAFSTMSATTSPNSKSTCRWQAKSSASIEKGPHALMDQELKSSPPFSKTGQPVLVPGDMGRASHLMVGLGNPLTWCSCLPWSGPGAQPHQIDGSMERERSCRIIWIARSQVMATSKRTIAEEMPDAYKDVDAVVAATEEAGLANRVARLKPTLVLKG